MTVVELVGEHDMETAETMLEPLLDDVVRSSEHVVVDLTETEFIDTSVVRGLARANSLARERSSILRIQLGETAIVRTALELTGALDRLDWVESRAAALDGAPAGALGGEDRRS